ncbi:FUSC family protein [Acetobacter aceti]|uniref:Fusaric acid resistance protein n=1 Tax=Acetobacter aceti TaxID=435 RepID=A0A6S6PJ57_ACEAC|nr:FUSC family protein [Acetobacter aceti]BCI67353.1 fusaric acid resistance protein [Acetobacter aceti]
MARPATDTSFSLGKPGLLRLWRMVCNPSPGRQGHALRMAAGCTATVLVGEIWQVPDLAVPALVTMALWQKDRVTNALAGVAVNILIVLLLAFVYLWIRLTLDNPMALTAAIAGLSFCFFFLGSASKLKPVAYMLGLCVVFGLIAIDQVPNGELITRAILYVDLFLAVPGLVMLVIGLLICPSPRTIAMQGIAARLRMSATLLSGSDDITQERATDLLREGASGLLKSLKMARLEKIWAPEELARLEQAANASEGLLSLALTTCRPEGAAVREPPLSLIDALNAASDQFEKGICPESTANPALSDGQPAHQAMANILGMLLTVLPPEKTGEETNKEESKSGFFAADAFTNPDHTRFAVKGTAAVMLSYFIFSILNWQGIHTCIITCFIVAQPTMGEMISKLTLRIVGALIGGAIGIAAIIFVIPHFNDITSFLCLVFVVSLLAAWIKTGDERIAYAGFQIGIAFYLTDLKGYGPTTDMATARDRILGIMLGNFLTYAMFTSFWPSSAFDGIDTRLRTIVQRLGKQRDAVTEVDRLAQAASVQEAVSLAERQSEYAFAEPDHMRADMEYLEQLDGLFHEAETISAALLDPVARPYAETRLAHLESVIS